MKHRKRNILTAAVASALLLAAGTATAEQTAPSPFKTHVYPDTIIVEPQVDAAFDAAVDLIVRGPDGFRHSESFQAGELIEFDPGSFSDKPLADGTYVWELRVMDTGQNRDRSQSIASETRSIFESSHSGTFAIAGGQLASPDLEEPATFSKESIANASTQADDADNGAGPRQTISGDLSVYNSLCVGFDCAASESYGSDTIRLKENNTRIHFDDTSTAGSFPNNDWRLVANDQSNGGANRFSIEDATAGRQVFTVEAGARSNALYVDNGGRVGVGTNNPVLEMHVRDGDSPALRLEQDGSSGFQPQTWDVAGNETNFFVRDVTNGSTLPLRIRPSAPSSSLYIDTDGDVGLGTASPNSNLHINGGSSDAGIHFQQTGATPTTWEFRNQADSGRLNIGIAGGNTPLKIDDAANNNLLKLGTDGGSDEVVVTGKLLVNNTEINVPDYVFEPDYELMALSEVQSFIDRNGHLPNVMSAGEVAAQGGVSVSEMQLALLRKVEELTLYTLQQEATIQALQARLAKLETGD